MSGVHYIKPTSWIDYSEDSTLATLIGRDAADSMANGFRKP